MPEAAVHPVILRVPQAEYLALTLRERVRYLSDRARRALVISAGLWGVEVRPAAFEKEASGRPRPLRQGYWSVSHKPRYVAGVFSPSPVGIDVEQVRPYNPRLRRKVADAAEWRLVDLSKTEAFFRIWTAKEAVLKIGGVGIPDLLKCRVVRVPGRDRLSVCYRRSVFRVRHLCFDGHIAAVVEVGHPVHWTFPEKPGRSPSADPSAP